jgi:anthranilate phosphoribosyltransferase
VRRQVVGVFSPGWLEPIAETLRELGSERVWVVHGSDGLDELTTTASTRVVEVRGSELREFEVRPGDAGLPTATLADLAVGGPAENAAAARALLAGEPGPVRDMVLLNAAAGLVVADLATDLADGVARAAAAVDDGRAAATLERLVTVSRRVAG